MDFVLGHGASYMEADIRDMTDKEGFCRAHFKKMFDYGNSLGNAWILKPCTCAILRRWTKNLRTLSLIQCKGAVFSKSKRLLQFHRGMD